MHVKLCMYPVESVSVGVCLVELNWLARDKVLVPDIHMIHMNPQAKSGHNSMQRVTAIYCIATTLALEDVTILVSGLVLVVQHLDKSLILDILLGMFETDTLPFGSSSLLVLSTLSLLVLFISNAMIRKTRKTHLQSGLVFTGSIIVSCSDTVCDGCP